MEGCGSTENGILGRFRRFGRQISRVFTAASTQAASAPGPRGNPTIPAMDAHSSRVELTHSFEEAGSLSPDPGTDQVRVVPNNGRGQDKTEAETGGKENGIESYTTGATTELANECGVHELDNEQRTEEEKAQWTFDCPTGCSVLAVEPSSDCKTPYDQQSIADEDGEQDEEVGSTLELCCDSPPHVGSQNKELIEEEEPIDTKDSFIDEACSLPGPELTFVDEKFLPEEMICSLCCNVMREPMMMPCCKQARFCHDCFQRLLIKKSTCPFCRRDITEVSRDKCLHQNVSSFLVHCVHQRQGCDWVGPETYLGYHVRSCHQEEGCQQQSLLSLSTVPCTNTGCDWVGMAVDLQAHLDECEHMPECTERKEGQASEIGRVYSLLDDQSRGEVSFVQLAVNGTQPPVDSSPQSPSTPPHNFSSTPPHNLSSTPSHNLLLALHSFPSTPPFNFSLTPPYNLSLSPPCSLPSTPPHHLSLAPPYSIPSTPPHNISLALPYSLSLVPPYNLSLTSPYNLSFYKFSLAPLYSLTTTFRYNHSFTDYSPQPLLGSSPQLSLCSSLDSSLQTLLGSSLQPLLGSSVQPLFGSSTQPLLDSTLRSLIDSSQQPLLDSSLQPLLGSSMQPLLGSFTQPLLDSTLRSLIDSYQQPLLDSSLQPLLGSSLQPLLGSSMQPLLGSFTQPLLNFTLQPLVDSSQQPLLNSTLQRLVDSSQQPLLDSSLQPLLDFSLQPLLGSSLQPLPGSSMQPLFSFSPQPFFVSSLQPLTLQLSLNSSPATSPRLLTATPSCIRSRAFPWLLPTTTIFPPTTSPWFLPTTFTYSSSTQLPLDAATQSPPNTSAQSLHCSTLDSKPLVCAEDTKTVATINANSPSKCQCRTSQDKSSSRGTHRKGTSSSCGGGGGGDEEDEREGKKLKSQCEADKGCSFVHVNPGTVGETPEDKGCTAKECCREGAENVVPESGGQHSVSPVSGNFDQSHCSITRSPGVMQSPEMFRETKTPANTMCPSELCLSSSVLPKVSRIPSLLSPMRGKTPPQPTNKAAASSGHEKVPIPVSSTSQHPLLANTTHSSVANHGHHLSKPSETESKTGSELTDQELSPHLSDAYPDRPKATDEEPTVVTGYSVGGEPSSLVLPIAKPANGIECFCSEDEDDQKKEGLPSPVQPFNISGDDSITEPLDLSTSLDASTNIGQLIEAEQPLQEPTASQIVIGYPALSDDSDNLMSHRDSRSAIQLVMPPLQKPKLVKLSEQCQASQCDNCSLRRLSNMQNGAGPVYQPSPCSYSSHHASTVQLLTSVSPTVLVLRQQCGDPRF